MENQKKESTQVEPQNNEGKPHQKGQKRQRKQYKSQHVFDAEAITINTQLPALPKKSQLLKKPQFEQTKEREKKIRQKITKLIEQKKQIRAQNFNAQKTNKKQGGENNKFDAFKNEIESVKELRERLGEVKKQRNQKRQRLTKLIEEAKQTNATLKELGGQQKGSKQNLLERLDSLQSRLISAKLTKQQQKALNNEIATLKRKIQQAQSGNNIEYRIAKAEERKKELDHEIQQIKQQKQPLEKEFKELQEQLDKKNQSIDGLKKDIDTDKKDFLEEKEKNSKEWEKWKETKKKRLDDIQQKIQKLKQQQDKVWSSFELQKQAYWKQKHYIDWVQWQMKVKSRKVNEIQREKRRQEYQLREKQYEKQDKLQKYIGQIQLCNFLVQYLTNLKQDWNKANEADQNSIREAVDVGAKLAADSEWKKQKVQLLKSKKSQVEQQAPKKGGKKNKNKNQEKKEEPKGFSIPYIVQNQFQSLKVLAPVSIEQIDKKIEELRERQRLFERCCQQEQASEEDTKLIEEIKAKKPSAKKQGETKKQQVDEQFPTI